MVDVERDIRLAKQGTGEDLVYKTIAGLKADLTAAEAPEILAPQEDEDSDEESQSSDEGSEGEQGNLKLISLFTQIQQLPPNTHS